MIMAMEEEDAFWALASLMESPKYFQHYYSEDLWRVQVCDGRDAVYFLSNSHLIFFKT